MTNTKGSLCYFLHVLTCLLWRVADSSMPEVCPSCPDLPGVWGWCWCPSPTFLVPASCPASCSLLSCLSAGLLLWSALCPPTVACRSTWVDICMPHSLGTTGHLGHHPCCAMLNKVGSGALALMCLDFPQPICRSGELHRHRRPSEAPPSAISNLAGWMLAVA